MDGVECPQERLAECSSRQEQGTLERPQGDGVEQFVCAFDQGVNGQAGIEGPRSPDCSRQLGQHQLTGNEIGTFEGPAQGDRLGLVDYLTSADESA